MIVEIKSETVGQQRSIDVEPPSGIPRLPVQTDEHPYRFLHDNSCLKREEWFEL